MKARIVITIIAITLTIMANACAREHPVIEHPTKEEVGLTKETLAKAITDYAKKDATLKGGYFLVYDQLDKKPLVLTLVKVHEDRLSPVGKGVYFTCADFNTPDGTLYDLDIFMNETDGNLQVTEITIHKVAGKARYNWVEKKGIWVREGL